MPIIQKSRQCLFINLPKEYTDLLGWKKKDTVAVFPSDREPGTLIVKKVK